MRTIILSMLTSMCGISLAGQELTPIFEPIIPVTVTSANGSSRPRIALVNDTVPLVTWTKTGSGNGVVYAARWNGASFGAAVQISPSGLNVYCSAGEGGDIAARGDTAFIVFFTTDSRCFAVRSIDGGATWGDTVRIDHTPTGEMAYTPDVQILPGGNPVVVFETANMSFGNPSIRVCRSDDGGQTFMLEQNAHDSLLGQPCECCPPALVLKDSMTYAIYRNNNTNVREIVMTISSDTGSTFPVTSEFDQTNWILTSCPVAGADAAFFGDSIVAVWKSTMKIYFATAHASDGGEGPHYLLEPLLASNITQRNPAICATGDTIVYVWEDRRTSNYDTYIAITTGGPQQIAAAFIFNDTIGTTENGTQQNAHVAYGGNRIHLVYQDLSTGNVFYRRAAIGGIVGVAEQPASVAVEIFPVPAHESLTIQGIEGKCTVTIYNMNGEIVSQIYNVVSGQIISVAGLARGGYSVLITTEDGTKASLPIIKQ
jgi:hypothetical protein